MGARTTMANSPAMATTSNLPSFIIGVVVLAYLATFVLFAALRILTGISIQRVGYLSLRRIYFEPRDGIKIEVRRLGLNFHRPTFTQPTWISIVVRDSKITLDLREKPNTGDVADVVGKDSVPATPKIRSRSGSRQRERANSPAGPNGNEEKTDYVETVRKTKETLKKLHQWINYIKLVDVVVVNTTVKVPDVGSIHVGSVTMLADTRRKGRDRNTMFDHCKKLNDNQHPVEWLVVTKNVLFYSTKSKEPTELMDYASTTLYGVVDEALQGIRDLAISVKIGQVDLPCDALLECRDKLRIIKRGKKSQKASRLKDLGASLSTVMEEMAMHGSRTERMAEAVMESKEILNSLLRGIKEVQFAIGHLVVSKVMRHVQPSGKPLRVIMSMKELGIDMHRLDQESPAHRMYFSSKDIAHQALLAAISISLSVDDGKRQDKIVYIPMVTMTSRTTLLSKTIEIVEQLESNRNTNILYANMVMTSPAIDLEPRHLPVLIALFKSRPHKKSAPSERRAHLMSRLLPKANIKFSIQEPVIRISLPPTEEEFKGSKDMDMLISSLSTISLDLESFHESDGQAHYALDSSLRLTNHVLYYRAASGAHHDLLRSETFDLKVQLSATPEVHVAANAYLSMFSLRLARPEIVQGLKQMVVQLRRNYKPDKTDTHSQPPDADAKNFLRQIPLWLDNFKMECNDFVVEVAGVDQDVSDTTRGVALQMEGWTVTYSAKRTELEHRPTQRRRVPSRTVSSEDMKPKDPAPESHGKNPTDGRRLALHIREVDGFIVESPDTWEENPFLQIPQIDLSITTGSDFEGPLMNFGSIINSFFLHYSLYRHYSIIVAGQVLKEAFGKPSVTGADAQSPMSPTMSPIMSPISSPISPRSLLSPDTPWGRMDMLESPVSLAPEFWNIDVKLTHFKLKANFPDDPPLMLEIHGVDCGRHRWGFPSLKAKALRLYVESPKMKKCWARMISMRHARVDLRQTKQRSDGVSDEKQSLDIAAEAIRVAVPNQVIIYNVIDNIVNSIKACQQMHHRFKTGTNEYILDKEPEGPKNVIRTTLRTKALLLELEDDPFETKLGMIYRVGLTEQKKRIARLAAFDAKVKKMEESQPRRSCETTRTGIAHYLNEPSQKHRGQPGRTRTWRSEHHAARGDEPDAKHRSKWHRTKSSNKMRYDPEAAHEPSESATVSIEVAWRKLQEHESSLWIKRINAAKEQQRERVAQARESFWGEDDIQSDGQQGETILGLPLRPALLAAYINDVFIAIDKPSFPLNELPDFLNRVGKGLPKDTEFALLIPVNARIDFNEARILLRDYPLPFIHVPPMHRGSQSRVHSWSLQSDFVIAEEFRGAESMRDINVCIVPPGDLGGKGFGIDIRRTVSPVKSYSDIRVAINSAYATKICWCMSYQPAIQDMMMVFETLTKPHVDPSDGVGFWDKIRLVFHSELRLAWEGGGDVHLMLKGSRDPYNLTGDGAGFVMCWRGNVRWDLNGEDDPEKRLKVESEEYLLAVPDFTRHAAEELEYGGLLDHKSYLSSKGISNGALFKKVIMKLSGKVQILVGLMFEQELTDEDDWKLRKRSSDFIPHYEVTLKDPKYCKPPPGEVYDAFKGFRSHHLHLSIAIISPADRDWNTSGGDGAHKSYNTIHLTPRFFTHFYAWWNLFSGALSLPVRQGNLWPDLEKASKKFGRHLATVKYKLCVSPLFISHIYKHTDQDETGQEVVAATGLKARLESFLLDIHQRREEALPNPKSTTMTINQAELDFHEADIRAVSAYIDKLSIEDLISQASISPDDISLLSAGGDENDSHSFVDGDYRWVDLDDFVELDWALPKNRPPRAKIIPLAYTPRFTYFRQTDHSEDGKPECSLSPFGKEATHSCIMSQDNDPLEIQCGLVVDRLEKVNKQMRRNRQAIDLLAERTKSNPDDSETRAESENLIKQSSILFDKQQFLQNMLRKIQKKLDDKDKHHERYQSNVSVDSNVEGELFGIDSTQFIDYASDFDNRFIVHNMQAKWNNSLRNVIMKYIHQVGQRRGFVYYMSRRAVKFILDIIDEQEKAAENEEPSTPSGLSPQAEDPQVEERIRQLLKDDLKSVIAEDPPLDESPNASPPHLLGDDLAGDLTEDYIPQNSYHVRLIAPQIQMQSEKNEGAAVLVAAQGMQLKVVSVMDRERVGDDVSGLVQRRFALSLDNTQFFVSHHRDFVPQSMSLHSANRYGAPHGSSWPPWVPLESMFDFRNHPVGFSRVVERTSATLRYEKHNSLRLKYGDRVSGNNGPPATKSSPAFSDRPVDTVTVDFPRVEASCDSSQYFAMYIIVLDLLLYSEPLEKLRNEKLEKIMLASDFSDLTGAPEMVERLQGRIYQLAEIKQQFELNAKSLDLDGWKSRLSVDQDLTNCEDELFFMMKAITTAQRKFDDRSSRSSTAILRWLLQGTEIVWHMTCDNGEPLMDMSLTKAVFKRSDNADGSNLNEVEVQRMKGYNLLENAVYPEMITPYFRDEQSYIDFSHARMLRVTWNMLEAIGGIPIMERFEVHLHPLKVQLERDVGERIFRYIFPGVGEGDDSENHVVSPFLVHSMKPIADNIADMPATIEFPDGLVIDDSTSERSEVEFALRPTMSLTDADRPASLLTNTDIRPKTSSSAMFSRTKTDSSIATIKDISAETVTLGGRRSLDGGNGTASKRSMFSRSSGQNGKQASDELSQMMSRASNYMTLSYIKIPGVTLCLSYKGRSESNFEDIHEFVFRLPTLEYSNKTWSNYDLAMHLKRDIIRALISHTGAILQNKLTNHRPSNKPGKNKKNLTVTYGSQNGSSASSIRNQSSSASSIFKFGRKSDTSSANLQPPTENMDPGTPKSMQSAPSVLLDDGESPKSSSSVSVLTAPPMLGRVRTAESDLAAGGGDTASIITAHNTAASMGAGMMESGPDGGGVGGEEKRPGSAGTATTAVKGSKRGLLKKKVFGGL